MADTHNTPAADTKAKASANKTDAATTPTVTEVMNAILSAKVIDALAKDPDLVGLAHVPLKDGEVLTRIQAAYLKANEAAIQQIKEKGKIYDFAAWEAAHAANMGKAAAAAKKK